MNTRRAQLIQSAHQHRSLLPASWLDNSRATWSVCTHRFVCRLKMPKVVPGLRRGLYRTGA